MNKIDLIKRNTVEIINEAKISSFVKRGIAYCGYETSGEIHLGHLVTLLKLFDLQKAGIKIKILLADWHTWLNQKGDWKFVNNQIKNWEKGIRAVGLKAQIINGSNFQSGKEYISDLLKLSSKTTVSRGLRSMQEVARNIESAKISQIIYPLMQVVDVKELKVNFVVSGLEQRKVYMLGVDEGKEINLQDVVYIYTPLIPSLTGKGKMSSSEGGSFISIRDSKENIIKKINKAYCPGRVVENNPLLAITRLIIFPKFGEFDLKGLQKEDDTIFKNYRELEEAFERGFVWPSDLKKNVAEYLEKIIAPIRKKWR